MHTSSFSGLFDPMIGFLQVKLSKGIKIIMKSKASMSGYLIFFCDIYIIFLQKNRQLTNGQGRAFLICTTNFSQSRRCPKLCNFLLPPPSNSLSPRVKLRKPLSFSMRRVVETMCYMNVAPKPQNRLLTNKMQRGSTRSLQLYECLSMHQGGLKIDARPQY